MPARMTVIAIGRAPATAPEQALFDRYAARLRPPLGLVVLPNGKGGAAEIRRREGEAILTAIPEGALLVALDQGGVAEATEAFARRLGRWRESGRELVFAIGGAEGLDRAVIERAAHVMSLGPLTWPHLIARALLAEALFRAESLRAGHPYHRAGRP